MVTHHFLSGGQTPFSQARSGIISLLRGGSIFNESGMLTITPLNVFTACASTTTVMYAPALGLEKVPRTSVHGSSCMQEYN